MADSPLPHRDNLRQLSDLGAALDAEVERIWPTPAVADLSQHEYLLLRQLAALTEEVGEVSRAVLKRSHLEGVDTETRMANTLGALRARSSILADGAA